MTGFASSEVEIDGVPLSITARSVNHRGFEFYLRSGYPELEISLRQKSRAIFQRGKVELVISFSKKLKAHSQDRFKAKVLEFTNALSEMGIYITPDASTLYRIYERSCEPDFDCNTEKLLEEIDNVFLALDSARKKEGESHLSEFRQLLSKLKNLRVEVEARAGTSTEEKKEILKARLLALSPIDDNRLLQEIAILADKLSITEELIRLAAHEHRFGMLLDQDGVLQGREIEFLCQEFLREWNTIGSKSQDSVIAHAVVNAKGNIEQIRELAANVV
jgi:uncharacterized protein (TIGR00255 family)